MALIVPNLIDLKFKRAPAGDQNIIAPETLVVKEVVRDEDDPSKIIEPAIEFGFGGWWSVKKFIDLQRPKRIFNIHVSPPNNADKALFAFYVDKAMVLWTDCSWQPHGTSEQDRILRDLCLYGEYTDVVATRNLDERVTGGLPIEPVSIISSENSKATGYFFKIPYGAHLSVRNNSNFSRLVRTAFTNDEHSLSLITVPTDPDNPDATTTENVDIPNNCTWNADGHLISCTARSKVTTSFTYEMWAKPAHSRDVTVENGQLVTHPRYIELFLMNRSHAVGGTYAWTGYSYYWKIGRNASAAVINYDPFLKRGKRSSNMVVTPHLSVAAGYPGVVTNVTSGGNTGGEWGTITTQWDFFAYSLNHITSSQIFMVRGPNCYFVTSSNYKDNCVLYGNPYEMCYKYGITIGGTYQDDDDGKLYSTPELCCKSLKLYNRAKSFDELEQEYQDSLSMFPPSKIYSRFHRITTNEAGNITGEETVFDRGDKFVFVYQTDDDWGARVNIPRSLRDLSVAGNAGVKTNIFDNYCIGFSKTENATVPDAGFAFNGSNPISFQSTDIKGLVNHILYPVIPSFVQYCRYNGSNWVQCTVGTGGRPDDGKWYYNFGAKVNASRGILDPDASFTKDGMTYYNYEGWTLSRIDNPTSTKPECFLGYSTAESTVNISSWNKISTLLQNGQNVNSPLSLYAIYRSINTVPPATGETTEGEQYLWQPAESSESNNFTVSGQSFPNESRNGSGLVVEAKLSLMLETGNDHQRKISSTVKLYKNGSCIKTFDKKSKSIGGLDDPDKGNWFEYDLGNYTLPSDFGPLTNLVQEIYSETYLAGGSEANDGKYHAKVSLKTQGYSITSYI